MGTVRGGSGPNGDPQRPPPLADAYGQAAYQPMGFPRPDAMPIGQPAVPVIAQPPLGSANNPIQVPDGDPAYYRAQMHHQGRMFTDGEGRDISPAYLYSQGLDMTQGPYYSANSGRRMHSAWFSDRGVPPPYYGSVIPKPAYDIDPRDETNPTYFERMRRKWMATDPQESYAEHLHRLGRGYKPP
jgi:hypothetical protein